MLNPAKGIALFTDGSSYHKDGSGGWAWVAIDCFGGEEVGSGYASDTTNNRMEMQAWIEGLVHLFKSPGPCNILVYSDSEYVGLGAMDRDRLRKKNKDLWLEIDAAIDRHKYVEFVWVKGHHESYYNKLADELAGNARRAMMSEIRRGSAAIQNAQSNYKFKKKKTRTKVGLQTDRLSKDRLVALNMQSRLKKYKRYAKKPSRVSYGTLPPTLEIPPPTDTQLHDILVLSNRRNIEVSVPSDYHDAVRILNQLKNQ